MIPKETRDTIEKIRKDVEGVDYIFDKESGEPCIVFHYHDRTQRLIRVTKEEHQAMKILSEFIVGNWDSKDKSVQIVLIDKKDVFDAIMNNAIKRELILAKYDPEYFKDNGAK